MGKNKLKRFAENSTFTNVFQPEFNEVLFKDYERKGRWKDFFGNDHPLTLELGCGKGEYTIGLARLHPERNFMGMDIKGARFWRGAKTAQESGLHNVAFIRTRLHFIPSFFSREDLVDTIWITFPDPQPRLSKEGKRLTSPEFLERYRQFALPHCRVNLKTDSLELFEYTLEEVVKPQGLAIHALSRDVYKDFSEGPLVSIQTFYEKHWLGEGKTINYIQFSLFPNS